MCHNKLARIGGGDGGAGFATPVCFKWAVEAVGRGPVPGPLWQQPVLRALLAAGACRAVSGIARDLQSPMFQLISQVTPSVHTVLCPASPWTFKCLSSIHCRGDCCDAHLLLPTLLVTFHTIAFKQISGKRMSTGCLRE